MILAAESLTRRVTFITGPEKGSGKTTLLVHALGLLRLAGERPAFLGIGFDGERDPAARAPRIACLPGEVFVTAAACLATSGCWPEVLAALPGSSALGRLAVVRARREGRAVLVGSERNEYSARAIELIRAEDWARTVLVDGAMNRITQVAAFPGARFLFAVRASPADLERNAAAVRRLALLVRLPALGTAAEADLDHLDDLVRAAGLPVPASAVDGALTADALARAPRTARTLVVHDFTRVFLDLPALTALLSERALAVRAGVAFGGFSVTLRDVSRARFLQAVADPAVAAMIAFNPLETAADAAPGDNGAGA